MVDPVNADDASEQLELIAELEAALAGVRAQQALIRGSLATVIDFLNRPEP